MHADQSGFVVVLKGRFIKDLGHVCVRKLCEYVHECVNVRGEYFKLRIVCE